MKAYAKKNKETRRIWRKICKLADLELKGVKQEHFYSTLVHSNKHTPGTFKLMNLIEKTDFWSFFASRDKSYTSGLIGKIFDVSVFGL